MFFIRKLDNIPEVSLQQLVTGGHAEIPVELLKWLMKGCQVTAVTGMQGCGKTPREFIKILIDEIDLQTSQNRCCEFSS